MIVLPARGLPVRRQLAGGLVAALGLPVLLGVLAAERDRLSLATPVLLVLSLVVVVALLGGVWPAVPAALVGALALNYLFTPPLHKLTVERPQDLLVLCVYLAVAVSVSTVVDLAARRTAEAARAAAEAEALSSVAGASLSEQETLPALLERVRTVFRASQVELRDERALPIAVVGTAAPGDVEQEVPAGSGRLVVRGPELFAEDRRVLQAFADAASTALAGRRLAQQKDAALALDRQKTALLAAVGHDLRTPLAGVRAAVSSLRASDVEWTADEQAELLATIDESAVRLQGLVSNLLDASRLQAGAVTVSLEAVLLEEVAARAVAGLAGRERVVLEVPEALPPVVADEGLLERVVANLVENALRHDPGQVLVMGGAGCVSVVDHGPGIADVARAFEPFQRLDDRSPGGVGLGLAVARGFVEAMHGTLVPSVTEGGGVTMTVTLPT